MIVGVMATDGGPHPPEKWASVTASQVINIAAQGEGLEFNQARDFEQRVTKILTAHHDMVQSSERTGLEAAGPDGLVQPMNHADFVDDALDDILSLSEARDEDGNHRYSAKIRGHFARHQTQEYLRRLLTEHFHHSMVIERSWHADAHRDHKHAKAFHAAMRGEAKPDHPAMALMNPHFRPEVKD